MNKRPAKTKPEQLFEELIDIKILLKQKEKALKKNKKPSGESFDLRKELNDLRKKIETIEKNISQCGESFLDVYDEKLMNPLSESDIIDLRDQISEIRKSIEGVNP